MIITSWPIAISMRLPGPRRISGSVRVEPLLSMLRRRVMPQCHLACFRQVCCLRFWEVDECDDGRAVVAGAVVGGFFDAVGVVAAAFDDAGVGLLSSAVEVAWAGDVGFDLVQGAAWLVRGEKPGRRPGGGRRG